MKPPRDHDDLSPHPQDARTGQGGGAHAKRDARQSSAASPQDPHDQRPLHPHDHHPPHPHDHHPPHPHDHHPPHPRDEPSRSPVLRNEGVALWRQIAGRLQQDIAGGTLLPGARLPTEAELSQQFGVNRHTVRRALEELSREGLVRVEQGRGSFVAEDVLDYTVEPRTRFTEWIRKHNMEPSGRVLQLKETVADAQVAGALGLRTGARVLMLERLGLADDRPVSLGRHYFPATRFRGLLEALRATPRITEALQAVGVTDYLRQVTRVSARLPTPTEAELLRMPRNRPVLITENVNVDRIGSVVEFGIGCYPTPRVQIVFEP